MKYVDCKYCDFHARSEASLEDHLEWEHKEKLNQDLEATDPSHTDERIDGEENLINVDLTSEGVIPKFSQIRQPGEVIIIYIPHFLFLFFLYTNALCLSASTSLWCS